MNATYACAIVDHKLMRSIRESIEIRLCPIVGVSKVKFFRDLQINKGDERISGTIGEPCTENVVENKGIVQVSTERLTFLLANQYRWIDLDFVESVHR